MVDVPGIGGVSKKQGVIFGGLAVVVVGVAYYRHKQNTANASASAVTDPNSIDPATGYAYGSTQDQSALTANATDTAAYNASGGGNTGTSTPIQAYGPPSSNGAWTQQATAYLVDTVGLASASVSAALAKYISGEAVTDAEKSIIEQAIASEGLPPQAGSLGYPPNIKLTAQSGATHPKLATPTGVKVTNKTTQTGHLYWSPVNHATHYSVHDVSNGSVISVGATNIVVPTGRYTVTAQATDYTDSSPSAIVTA